MRIEPREQRDDDSDETHAAADAVHQAVLRAEHFDHARERPQSARKKCGQHQPPRHVDAGIARGQLIEAGDDQFVSERHFLAAAIHTRAAAAMAIRIPACARVPGKMNGSQVARGSCGVSGKASRRSQRAGHEILQDENRDVIGHQRNQDFVSAEPRANQADEARPHAARGKAD